jgi:hypothetical protein
VQVPGGLSVTGPLTAAQINLGGARILSDAGTDNLFAGISAGVSNTTASDNTFIGFSAGQSNGTNDSNPPNANYNTFVGSRAGSVNTTGSSNTLIGTNAEVGASNLNNATAVGAKAQVSQNNSLVLGSINGINSATSDTNVGIGTSTPGFKLHIAGYSTHDWPIIKLQDVDSGGHSYWLYSGANGVAGDFGIYDETAGAYRFYIQGSGSVGIGTPAPDMALSVNGNADKLGGGSWLSFSDERLKNIRGGFGPGLEAVMQLQPLRYEYKRENTLGIKPDGEHIGFSAQAVQKVIPEAVTLSAGKQRSDSVGHAQRNQGAAERD